MKLSLVKIAVLVLVFLTTTAFAQYQGLSYNFFGGGARSEGMGQAFLSVSDDASAGTWNPAGLFVQEKTIMQFSYGAFMPRGEETFYFDPDIPLTGGVTGTSVSKDHDGEYLGIDHWSILSPLRVKGHHVVLSMGYNRNFDTYNTFSENLLYERLNWGPLPNTKLERQGSINSIVVGFGTRISEKFAFGLSGNIYSGKVVSEEIRYLRYFLYDEFDVLRAYRNSITVIDSTSYTGFNATVGLLFTGDPVRIGLTLKTPFNLKGSSDSSMIYHATENGLPIDNVTFLDEDSEETAFFEFVSDTVYVDDMTSKLQMPFVVGLGASFNARENLLISGDVEYRGFSGKKIKTLDYLQLTAGGERIESFSDIDPNWQNVFQYRLGAEFTVETPIAVVPLRVGFRNEAFPESNVTGITKSFQGERGSAENDSTRIYYTFDYGDEQISGNSFAFGFGLHWTQIQLDFAYTYTKYEQELYAEEGFLRFKNEWVNHRLNASFTGYF